jgi:hypothetical protein
MSSDSSDVSKFNRRKGQDNYKGDKKSLVDNEVKKLFRDNAQQISQSAMYRLREKFGDEELLDQIQDAFMERSREIRKRAKKFARMITERYQSQNYPLHILLKKALKYKKKYNLADSEFEEFRRIYEQTLTGTEQPSHVSVTVPFTNMSRALGQGNIDANDGMKFDDKDYSTIHDVLRLYAEKKPTHAQVVLQSIVYKDTAFEALTGEFLNERHNPHCHIHPVVAALFLPKMNLFENHMLRSNIAYIVKTRYTKQPILTSTDYELFYNLISDPTDVVCSSESAVKDLANRAQLQAHLWDSVLSLRNGRYYDCNSTHFLMAVDQCKRNNYESPDLLYQNDEGTMMQRLLGAFSLRPTIVATTPLYGVINNNPMRTHAIAPKVASLPMIVLRLPVLANNNNANPNIKLNDALDMSQWYVEDGSVVPRNQQIIYSRGALVFFVPRRAHTLNIGKLVEPMNFARLPATVAGFERVNDRIVDFEHNVNLREHTYRLRSVVCVEINKDVAANNGPKLVTGCSALLVKYGESVATQRYYWYNPRNAAVGYQDAAGAWNKNAPITVLDNTGVFADEGQETFYEKASKRGTIFVYEQENDAGINPIMAF